MHFWPQHRWICDPNGYSLMDFVGRYESVTSELEVISDMLDLPRSMAKIQRTNVSEHYPWQEYYHTQSRLKSIGDYYRADFEIFKYKLP